MQKIESMQYNGYIFLFFKLVHNARKELLIITTQFSKVMDRNDD